MGKLIRHNFGDRLKLDHEGDRINFDHESNQLVQRLLKLRGSPNRFCSSLYENAKHGGWSRTKVLAHLETIDRGLTSPDAYIPGMIDYRHRVWHETGLDPGLSSAERIDYEDQSDSLVKLLMQLRDSYSSIMAGLYDRAKESDWSRPEVVKFLADVESALKTRYAFIPGTGQYEHRMWLESLPPDYLDSIEAVGPTRLSEAAEIGPVPPGTSHDKETIAHGTRGALETVPRAVSDSRSNNETSAHPELDKTGSWYYGPFDFDRSQSDEDQAWKIPYQQVIAEISEDYYLGKDHKRLKKPKYKRLIAEAWRRVEGAGNSKGAGKTLPADDYVVHALSTELHADMVFMREVHAILLEDGWEDRYLDRTG